MEVTETAAVAIKPRRVKADNTPLHDLRAGDILVAQWGYTMAMVSFFEVKNLIGRQWVEVEQITQKETQTGFLSGRTEPVIPTQPDQHREGVLKRLVKNGRVYVKPYIIAVKHKTGETYTFDHCD